VNLTAIDWLLMAIYFAFVLGVGFLLRRRVNTSIDFFLTGRAVPAWVCGLASSRPTGRNAVLRARRRHADKLASLAADFAGTST